MDSCAICLEDIRGAGAVFKARPASCVCQFQAHQPCFDTWLRNNGAAYKCLICRVEVKLYTPRIYAYLTLLVELYALCVYVNKGPLLIARLGVFTTVFYLVFAYTVIEKLRRIVVRCQRLRG